jgi:TolA-binding protein
MRTRKWVGIFFVGLMTATTAQWAQASSVDDDFKFASGLVNFDPAFPDFAQKVVDAVLAKDPTQKDRSKVIQAEILIKRRKFAEAEAIINELGNSNPKAQAISLALGRNYFAIGEQDKARAIYDGFFKQYEGKTPTDPDIVGRYQTAAFQYAQMQEMSGDYEGAEKSYKRVEEIADASSLKRTMLISRAKALVKAAESQSGDDQKKLLDRATEICTTLQWGGLDLQFVDSLVIMANIQLAQGNQAGAKKILMDNMDIIKPIDDMLKEDGLPMAGSPMAGVRSLLGRLLKEEADGFAGQNKDAEALAAYGGALGEFYNVFIKYSKSSWGPTAGMEAKAIKDILETKYGKTVKIDLPANLIAEAAGTEFMMGDNLFRQKKYAEAAAEYLRVLKQFPEAGELSVAACGNLVQCYLHLNDPLYAKLMANYLGERFSKKSDIPAKALISAGKLYEDGGNAEMAEYMYDKYLTYCPTDAKAGTLLFYLAQRAEKGGNKELADTYYARLITDYQEDQNYTKALSRRAWRTYKDNDFAAAIPGMKIYIEESQPSPTKAQAMFALADCYRRSDQLPLSIRQFNSLIQAISPKDNPYGRSTADIERNEVLLQQARFYMAYGLSRMDSPKAQKMAIAKLDEFLTLYPTSDEAAKALNLKGSLQMALKDPGANETFKLLAEKYPNTDEGKSAQYARINGALELGQFEQARTALEAMLASPGSYSVEEFARVGQAMLEKEQWASAKDAFEQVNGKTEERGLLERALYGIGASTYELGDSEGAVTALDELMTRWPSSGLFYQAKFMLARANLQLGELNSAKLALNDIFKYAQERELKNDASLVYAEVLKKDNDALGALATYKRMEFFGSQNMKTEKERRQIEGAILMAIDLASELEKSEELLESCDTYLTLYPTSEKINEIRQKRALATVQVASDAAAATVEEANP